MTADPMSRLTAALQAVDATRATWDDLDEQGRAIIEATSGWIGDVEQALVAHDEAIASLDLGDAEQETVAELIGAAGVVGLAEQLAAAVDRLWPASYLHHRALHAHLTDPPRDLAALRARASATTEAGEVIRQMVGTWLADVGGVLEAHRTLAEGLEPDQAAQLAADSGITDLLGVLATVEGAVRGTDTSPP